MRICCSARLAALIGAVALEASAPARAQDVYCVNCSTVYDQLLQYAKEAQQYTTQLEQYGTQLRQYANMIQNTVGLPQMVWANVQGDIMQVRALMNAGSMLGGNAGGFTQRLGQLGSYSNQITSLGQMATQYQTWASVSQNDISQLQAALGLQQAQQATDAQILTALQQHSQSAQGQMQAIQAGNEMSALGVKQMQQLQVMLANESHVIEDQQGVQADRQAAQDQALKTFLAPPALPTTGLPGY